MTVAGGAIAAAAVETGAAGGRLGSAAAPGGPTGPASDGGGAGSVIGICSPGATTAGGVCAGAAAVGAAAVAVGAAVVEAAAVVGVAALAAAADGAGGGGIGLRPALVCELLLGQLLGERHRLTGPRPCVLLRLLRLLILVRRRLDGDLSDQILRHQQLSVRRNHQTRTKRHGVDLEVIECDDARSVGVALRRDHLHVNRGIDPFPGQRRRRLRHQVEWRQRGAALAARPEKSRNQHDGDGCG